MVEKYADTPEIIIGLAETPVNRLLMQPMFTPSKVGGPCASISPLPPAARECEKCGTSLTFLCQLYANVPDLDDFHRILYLFACLSQQCINTQCIRAFREIIPDQNKFLKLCSDAEYDAVCNKSNDELVCTAQWVKIIENIPEARLKITQDYC